MFVLMLIQHLATIFSLKAKYIVVVVCGLKAMMKCINVFVPFATLKVPDRSVDYLIVLYSNKTQLFFRL